MFVDLTGGKPIRCSKCGSTNAAHPANNRLVAIRCLDCNHQKLTEEGERLKFEEDHPDLARQMRNHSQSWMYKDVDPTF